MATLTSADLFAAYPELTTTDPDTLTRIGTFLDIAEQVIVEGFPTTSKRDQCRLAMAAHLTALANSDNCSSGAGARSGPVTGRTRGGRSVSYASPSASSVGVMAGLGGTRYGQICQLLLKGSTHRRVVVA